jgi:hypothetical protein
MPQHDDCCNSMRTTAARAAWYTIVPLGLGCLRMVELYSLSSQRTGSRCGFIKQFVLVQYKGYCLLSLRDMSPKRGHIETWADPDVGGEPHARRTYQPQRVLPGIQQYLQVWVASGWSNPIRSPRHKQVLVVGLLNSLCSSNTRGIASCHYAT